MKKEDLLQHADKALIGLFVVLFSYIIYTQRKSIDYFDSVSKSQQSTQQDDRLNQSLLNSAQTDPKHEKLKQELEMAEKNQPESIKLIQEKIVIDQQAKESFSEIARIEMNLPDGYLFKELDVDSENVKVIHGSNGDSNFTAIATDLDLTSDKALRVLSDSQDFVPTVDNQIFSKKPEIIKVPPNKNFTNVKAFKFRSSPNSPEVNAIFAKRKDGKGSYMFILDGPKGYFESNEEFYFNSLNSIKLRY